MYKFIRYILFNLISLAIATFVILALSWSSIRHYKKKFWKTKQREAQPDILKDPIHGEHKFAQLKNVRLHYVQKGDKDKKLMLFLHGYPEFWYTWRHQIKEFSKDYCTVAVDMRGYGDSEKPIGKNFYKMELLADDIRDLIKELGYQKCILIAHDWGGVVGHYFIRKYPEMLTKYIFFNTAYIKVLLDTVFVPSQFVKSWYLFLMRVPYMPEFLIRMNDYKILEKMLKYKATDEEIEAYKYTYRDYRQINGPTNYYRANFTPGADNKKQPNESYLNSLKVPGLYVHGGRDNAITEELGFKKSFKSVENVKFVPIPEADHFVHVDRHEEVNTIMREFLKSA